MKRFVATMAAGVLMLAGTGIFTMSAEEKEGRIQQRKENQQARIAQGVASGSLTPRETANLEHKESKLNGEIRADRQANGGRLTAQEKAQVNRQQNRLSRNIYRDKHNAAHQVR
jgi:hypothetical protein